MSNSIHDTKNTKLVQPDFSTQRSWMKKER